MREINNKGFTIIELMVATAVFSSVMIICLMATTQIGRMFYRGITASRTQETARLVLDDVKQAIQFAGSSSVMTRPEGYTPTGGQDVLCIGKSRYVLRKYVQLTSGSSALQRDTLSAPCKTSTDLALSNPKELLSDNTRLSKFDINPVGTGLYRISIRVVYGDDDLIECNLNSSLTTFVDCSQSDADKSSANCKGGVIGSQFCAASELTTFVARRI